MQKPAGFPGRGAPVLKPRGPPGATFRPGAPTLGKPKPIIPAKVSMPATQAPELPSASGASEAIFDTPTEAQPA
jgi:hypothetical protein